MIKVSPNQLLALKRGYDDLNQNGSPGIVRSDRSTLKSLVAKGLSQWADGLQDQATITDAGVAIIVGRTPCRLSGSSTHEEANVRAAELARRIGLKRRTGI